MNPKDGRVVSNFIVQPLGDKDVMIYGDGEQTRSFCFCDDLIEGCQRLMDSPPEVTGRSISAIRTNCESANWRTLW